MRSARRARRLARVALVIVLLVPALAAFPLDAAPAINLPATYHIAVDVAFATAKVSATETVELRNETGTPLESLLFNVTPLHFRTFTLASATVGSAPVKPTFDDVVMELPLATPLAPGAQARVTLAFAETVPDSGDLRYGFASHVLALGNWFPILAVYRAGRWDRHHYSSVGDPFVTDVADYDVRLTTGPDVVVAHSGELVSHQGGAWVFGAAAIRDFALALSDRYQTVSTSVGSTAVTAFFLPEDTAGGRAMLRYAAESLGWYNQMLGTYQYPSLDVAETISRDPTGVGQEYPNAIFIGSPQVASPGNPGDYLTYLTAHEVAHQWFYGLVGSDQVRQPFLDEGVVVNVTYQFLKARYPSGYTSGWNTMIATYQQASSRYGVKPLDTTVDDYPNDTVYFSLLYRRGAFFMDDVRQALGDAAYFAMLRDYVAQFSGGIATIPDLLRTIQSHAPRDLTPLFGKYFTAATVVQLAVTATATAIPPSATATVSPSPSPTPTETSLPPSQTRAPPARPTQPTGTAEASTPTLRTPVVVAASVSSPSPSPSFTAAATPTPSPSISEAGAVGGPPVSTVAIAGAALCVVGVGLIARYAIRR